ncbi:MAG: aminoacetone oxidase family FAD-binding enzyme [Planctomycetaceae bacterium]|jgi:predicted Rossmann fold flavoprotein|nr:aminoacetone oxidase family FAD-binding enzyme [Planctomycetaceae bacterium]
MNHFEFAIIGGGVAGLCAAVFGGNKICVIERNNETGKKLLLSGSGQCNITHGGKMSDFLNNYGDNKKSHFVKPALFAFDNIAVTNFFIKQGIQIYHREDGKIFPQSMRSYDVREVLTKSIKEKIITNTTVINVTKNTQGFVIETESSAFTASKLLLATGGCSYPSTGSNGDGYKFAKSLGHTIIQPKPALAPIIIKNFRFANSAGISFRQVKIEIYRNEKRIHHGIGDVLLTHRGLSGPGILNLSRYVEPNDEIRIPIIDPKLESEIFRGKKILKNVLSDSGVPSRFVMQLLCQLEVPFDLPAAEISREIRKQLVSLSFIVEQIGNWNEAMSTAGGVAIDEVNRRTMESRIVPNLFFAGEILDIDGNCGGYNIHFALATGKLAAISATSK